MSLKYFWICFLAGITGLVPGCFPGFSPSPDDTRTMYYVRYDTFMVRNRAVRDNLVMVPAYGEFRVEGFGQVRIPCTLSPAPRFEKKELHSQAIHTGIKQILENKGLIYVTTLNTTTVVSYEGLVRSPFHVYRRELGQNRQAFQNSSQFVCVTEFEFSPLSFPDQWARQQHVNHLKQNLSDMWEILK